MNSKGIAGRAEQGDIFIEMVPNPQGGTKIAIENTIDASRELKVSEVIEATLAALDLKHVEIGVRDHGAPDWVIMARVEAAAKRFRPDWEGVCVPDFSEENRYYVERDRIRRSLLFQSGNEPVPLIPGRHGAPDGIVLDLEDLVPPAEKDAARTMVRNALSMNDFAGRERMVRINQLPEGFEDLPYIVPFHPHGIVIPRCERAIDVRLVVEQVEGIKEQIGTKEPTFIIPMIETALGVVNAYEIGTASTEIVAVVFSADDLVGDIGARQTEKGSESFVARSQVVLAARAAAIQVIDTIYSDVANEEGLLESTQEAIGLGFDGKGCLSPSQIEIIHEAFRPTTVEIRQAEKIRTALEDAKARGDGIVILESRRIQPPVVARALKILRLAELYGTPPREEKP
jgi:citrate lyase subunit beta/citryl-CoA lyase